MCQNSLLLTDLYQLTMLHGYHDAGMGEEAVFEFFVRDLVQRNFLVAAGLEPVLEFLANAAFTPDELNWMRDSGLFPDSFVDELARWRFRGEVHAMAEGTIFFPNEPVLRVIAPIAEAQLVETRIVNLLHLHILLASKAVRSVLAAPEKLLVDFGLRRAHGEEAGLAAARASYMTGFAGTSNVLAGKRYGIPIYGTMAHSFIQAHDSESEAFETFARAEPDNVTLLIDTYDTEAAAQKVVSVAQTLKHSGITVRAVRLDSGDLAQHARRVRAILDRGGLGEVKIFASGGLDEYAVQRLVLQGAPIDGFGIGTRMDTAADSPYLDCAYKLTEYAGTPRLKRSEAKRTLPGRKQVFRRYDGAGLMAGDELTLEQASADGEPLLTKVMEKGTRMAPPSPLDSARARLKRQLVALPPRLRGLELVEPYPVVLGQPLCDLAKQAEERVRRMMDGQGH